MVTVCPGAGLSDDAVKVMPVMLDGMLCAEAKEAGSKE
jgi:hypothetical protein